MLEQLLVFLQYFIPKHLLSRLIGFAANSEWVWLKDLMINWFIKHYKVDMSIAEDPSASDYTTFNNFFIRKIKAGLRPIANAPGVIVSPVDGTVSQFGEIAQGRLIQAKGMDYSLDGLLGGTEFEQQFWQGQFITLYLSPKDYHRVHMPFTGKLLEMTYVPGSLFAVNQASTNQIPAIFAKNERVICMFETEIGKMAVIMIGAMIVASINTIWAGKVTPNKDKSIKSYVYNDVMLQRGQEMGYFSMGSTVIMLFEPKRMHWDASLHPDKSIKYGQKIGISVGRL
ncbi:MAG: archaetidylserine decarboxylase [Gammaproteobacteria bacterium]|jgi:phosphatidylserine decarboxylase